MTRIIVPISSYSSRAEPTSDTVFVAVANAFGGNKITANTFKRSNNNKTNGQDKSSDNRAATRPTTYNHLKMPSKFASQKRVLATLLALAGLYIIHYGDQNSNHNHQVYCSPQVFSNLAKSFGGLSQSPGQSSSSEIHQVRGLSGSGQRIELPCLVDQTNCGEVYYITWTRQTTNAQQAASLNSSSSIAASLLSAAGLASGNSSPGGNNGQQQQQWSRVYLYTGANDSAPHKPIGDLVSRANFVMPDKRAVGLAEDEERSPPMARLVIEDPKLSDEALYKCDVTYVKGKCPSISLVRVHIMALPAKAQIQIQSGQQPQLASVSLADGQLIGPYNEREQLRLSCLVYGGRPQPKSVIWRKIDPQGRTTNLASSIISSGKQPAQPNGGNNQQLVQVDLNHTLSSSDLGAKFECHIEHEALEQPATRVIVTTTTATSSSSENGSPDSMLDLHPARPVPPTATTNDEERQELINSQNSGIGSSARNAKSLDAHVFVDLNIEVASLDLFMSKVNKRNSSEPLREGDLVELECIAYNSKPPANISWFNGPEAIEQLEPTSAVQQLAIATTTLPTTILGSGSNNNNWPKQKLRHKRLLQRNQVHQNEDGQTYNTHSFLSIKLSRHENRAQISCRAQNAPMRQPLVKSLELQVQHAPIVLMEPAAGIVVSEVDTPQASSPRNNLVDTEQAQANSDNVIAAESSVTSGQQQQDVSIYCVYSANPSELAPNSTRWFKDGRPLSNIIREPALNSPDSQQQQSRLIESTTAAGFPVLTLRQVNRHDAGLYECQLGNLVGLSERLPQSEACRLEVNFRPSVQMRLFKPPIGSEGATAPMQSGVNFQQSELAEVDLGQELILPGNAFVLTCDVLEAQPSKIHKFHWFKSAQARGRPAGNAAAIRQQQQPQLISVSESNQLSLGALGANFTPASYSCAAFNSLGSSEPSNAIDLQLSYAPGGSFVRAVSERRLATFAAPPASSDDMISEWPQQQQQQLRQQTLSAGHELLLECVTPDLGQPRANIWLWFRNGQPIESTAPSGTNSAARDEGTDSVQSSSSGGDNKGDERSISSSAANRDNPITSSSGQDLSQASLHPGERPSLLQRRSGQQQQRKLGVPTVTPKMRLLNSGRHLLILSIQLAHKGNYSCVAVNRLGSGSVQSSSLSSGGQDSVWQLRVALAPSFVRPLPTRTYWPETIQEASVSEQVELVCHVQCEPICQVEWLRNNEPLELQKLNGNGDGNSAHFGHHVRQSIMDEDLEANQFRSIESRLVITLGPTQATGEHTGGQEDERGQRAALERLRRLERRRALSGANYSCQSGPNSMGPAARSTTKFIVQYPPENLLINAASDKLSLVEGSNGPRLSCEATGEPQVQYRWFLLRGGSSSAAPINQLASRAFESLATTTRSLDTNESPTSERQLQLKQQPRLQVASGLQGDELVELSSSATMITGASSLLDLSALSLDRRQAGRYICEASNALGQTRQSVYVNVLYKPAGVVLHLHSLDLTIAPDARATKSGNSALDSASNNRIRARPFKATSNDEYSLVCETSEDFIDLRKTLVLAPLLNRYQTHDETLSFKGSIFQTILNDKRTSAQQDNGATASANVRHLGKLAAGSNGNNTNQLKDYALTNQDETKSSDVIILNQNNLFVDTMDKLVAQESAANGDASLSGTSNTGNGDSWSKFNMLLLKFLNNYISQVKSLEERMFERERLASEIAARDRRAQNVQSAKRRSSQQQQQQRQQSVSNSDSTQTMSNDNSQATSISDSQLLGGTNNLITFACMAQDGNPMSNLSFDWSFGNVNLPETSIESPMLDTLAAPARARAEQHQQFDATNVDSKPILVYADDDYSIQVLLVRRLDTRSSLNPFQMSLLTLSVIFEPSGSVSQSTSSQPANNRSSRQSDERTTAAGHSVPQARAPIVKNRYQSFYNNLRSSNQNGNNNIQFAHEFETKPYNLPPSLSSSSSSAAAQAALATNQIASSIELNEHNWQEQLGNLLKCTVTNQIGTSEVCHARVNVEQLRLRGSLSSSTLSEFAKWRMPSLAHKSLLILSVLIACALIIFAASALLLGPYLRGLGLKRDESGRSTSNSSSKEESNTGQSTSSQKSSVLGLLGNGGDSSIQGSSDDDSSAAGRLGSHHLDCNNNNSNDNGSDRRALDQADRMMVSMDQQQQQLRSNGYHHNQLAPASEHNSSSSSSGVNYDKPRGLQQQEQAMLPSYHSHDNCTSAADRFFDGGDAYLTSGLAATNHRQQQQAPARSTPVPDSKTLHSSAGSRLLASLKFKSLSKFKVDRISDLSNFASRMENIRSLHTKNVSSSETNTTGLSLSGELPMTVASPTASSGSPQTFFGAASQRRSLSSGFNKRPMGAHQVNTSLADYYMYDRNVDHPKHHHQQQQQMVQQLRSQRLLAASNLTSMAPTYSNMINSPTNAMDEFIRQRELNMPIESMQSSTNAQAAFYGSQSVRHSATNNHSMYLLEDDLNNHHQHQFYPQHMNRGPPVYPRSHQPALYEQRFVGDPRPVVAARSSHRQQQQQQQILAANNAGHIQQQLQSLNNRFSVPAYNRPFGFGDSQALPTSLGYMDTIDSHLSRLPETVSMANSNLDQSQHIAYANSIETNTRYRDSHNDANLPQHDQSVEHIYDVNAYATPEQTPQRRPNSTAIPSNTGQAQLSSSAAATERPRVSQLIQSFNSKVPE